MQMGKTKSELKKSLTFRVLLQMTNTLPPHHKEHRLAPMVPISPKPSTSSPIPTHTTQVQNLGIIMAFGKKKNRVRIF